MSSTESELGSGLARDENHDLDPDETGALRLNSSVDQLGDDLAFRLEPTLEQFLGTMSSPERDRDIRTVTKTVLENDARVREAVVTDVEQETDRVQVAVSLATVVGDVEQVFTAGGGG